LPLHSLGASEGIRLDRSAEGLLDRPLADDGGPAAGLATDGRSILPTGDVAADE
jgi:hypothetical protein